MWSISSIPFYASASNRHSETPKAPTEQVLALAASVEVQAFPLEDYKAQLHTRDGDVKKHLGYRVVSKAEAEAIHKNGGKAVQSSGNGGRQIGPGLYILNSFQAWGDNDPNGDVQWDCVVTVDADEWDKWNKVYLPELFTFPKDAEKKKDTCKPLGLWNMFPTSRKNRPNKKIGKMGAADWGFVESVPGYGMGPYNEEKR